MSSASAAATCCGKSAGAGTDERTGPVIADLSLQKGRPCIGPTMHINIGIDSKKLIREAYNATLRALAFCSSVAGTIPKIFFWLGQISPHTLNSMMVPSHAPMPMMRFGREYWHPTGPR